MICPNYLLEYFVCLVYFINQRKLLAIMRKVKLLLISYSMIESKNICLQITICHDNLLSFEKMADLAPNYNNLGELYRNYTMFLKKQHGNFGIHR